MSDQYPIAGVPDEIYPPPDQLPTDIPDEIYLPPDLFPTDIPDGLYLHPEFLKQGEIVPVVEEKLVLADKNEFIKCQWVGCGGQFKGTIADLQKHFKEEHLREPKERWLEKREKFLDEVVYDGTLTDAQVKRVINNARVAKCLWMVNNRVPCTEYDGSSYSDDEPGYRKIEGMVKHIGVHLQREGLPNPFAEESPCCGYLYFKNMSRVQHARDCENWPSGKPGKKRRLNPEDEDQEEAEEEYM